MKKLISVHNLSKVYDGHIALDDVSFDVHRGEIFAIIGPNGAGKSTLIKIICQLLKPGNGRIDYHGLENLKQRIGYMPEESALYESMGVSDYLKFFSDLYKVKKSVAEKRINDLLNFLHLDEKSLGTMSKGMKRKVLLARSLINDPDLLIYDEPASGLDTVIARDLMKKIEDLKKKGKTIVISAHDLVELEKIADRLMIINNGKIDFLGTIDELKSKYGGTRYKLKAGRKSAEFESKDEMMKHLDYDGSRLSAISLEEDSLQEIFLDKYGNSEK